MRSLQPLELMEPGPELEAARRVVRAALAEDVGREDVTTQALVPPTARARGAIVARESGVLAGVPFVALVFEELAPGTVRMQVRCPEGQAFAAGEPLVRLEGAARTLLTGERLALNLLQRLAGIATLTRRFVEAVAGTGVAIYDTRKTTPGLRALEKYAVRCGGGVNHRMGLFDQALIKDNHLAVLARRQGVALAELDLAPAVAAIRARRPGCFIEVEVAELPALERVVAAAPDAILFDNFPPEALREAVAHAVRLAEVHGVRRPVLEASGGITLATARAYAETGVDRLSVGALTHAARALDLALDLDA
ncbi:MAG: nicotinate-nucleotide diphosphorylase (carboxylating) [Planctomycetota bacterium]|nr:MAG: nicotinate-nucleotide diphosphorylase (carboxylating) [Planctomycetota bacterium]